MAEGAEHAVVPMVTGYAHPLYAESLMEFGSPRELPRSGGWIIQRPIAGFPCSDAMGGYPLFACQDWQQLNEDLSALADSLVTLVVVTDPFGNYTPGLLQTCFPDRVLPFKEHFVVDLSRPLNSIVSAHHRRNTRKALKRVTVERCAVAPRFLDEWVSLYAVLIERHNIRGLARFSRAAFAAQFDVPGLVMFRATCKSEMVGMLLWYVQGEVGYYHLGAYSPTGYETSAAFALFQYALEHFTSEGLRWLNLGAGAGLAGQADGLTRFKQGWASGTRTAYFCGRVFDSARYAAIVRAKGMASASYFPAYRQGEFG